MPEPDEKPESPDPADGELPAGEETQPGGEGDPKKTGQEPDYKELWLKGKTKIEEANRVLRERDARAAEPVPVRQPATADETRARSEIAEIEADNLELLKLAPHDPVARSQLRTNRELINTKRGILDMFTLNKVPEDQQEALVRFYEGNRHRFGDLEAAREAFNGKSSAKELATLRAELAELKNGKGKAKDDEPRKDDVVRTHGRDLPIATVKARPMTETQWDEQQADLKEQGRHAEARELQNKLRAGEIVLRRG